MSKSSMSGYFATVFLVIVSERMGNFHFLNRVQCLQLAHDYDKENRQCAGNFFSDLKNTIWRTASIRLCWINSMSMFGSGLSVELCPN